MKIGQTAPLVELEFVVHSNYKWRREGGGPWIFIEYLFFMDLVLRFLQTLNLWCDNISATYLAVNRNPVFNSPTKCVESDFQSIGEKVTNHVFTVWFISTKDQLTNIMTKGLIIFSTVHFPSWIMIGLKFVL